MFLYIERGATGTLLVVGILTGLYKTEIKLTRMCKKHLHFDFESSIIIEHQKSASKTRSSKVKTLKKRSKKWLTKRTPIAILNKLSREKQADSEAQRNERKA